jgi:hypothetical protein
LKLEHIVKQGIFISGKLYCKNDDKNKLHIKAKGMDANSLDYSDFVDLLHNRNVIKEQGKTQSEVN